MLGDLTAQLVVGSAVIIPNNNPPIYGTIRWIGTIPPVHECIAGVELVRLTVVVAKKIANTQYLIVQLH